MIRTTRHARLLATVAVASGLTMLAAGCGTSGKSGDGSTGSTGAASSHRVLNVYAGATLPMTENFNPFAGTALGGTLGVIYEPLFYYNNLKDVDPTPLVGATKTWSEDGKTLTIAIKPGLKWSDGQPLTAKDVAYSFDFSLAKQSYLKSATATDDTTAVLTFDAPEWTNEFTLLGGTYMIPEHVWSKISDPGKDANVDPVGSGPYMLDKYATASYTLKANPNFRDAGKPAVKAVRYLAINNNQSAEDLQKTGKIDWQQIFTPDPKSLTASGVMGYVNTPQDPTVLYTCSSAAMGCSGPQTDVAVRQALNVAIDRTEINSKAWGGNAAAISPTFAQAKRDAQWIAPGEPTQSPQTADAAAAGKILEAAGYAKGSDGVYAKDGKKVEMTLVSVDGWTDYNQLAKLVASQASAAGIKIDASTVSFNDFADKRSSGKYQLIVGGVVGTSVPDPFQIYKDWFGGASTTKVGTALKPGTWNFSRYSNPEVDAAITAASQTTDVTAKQQAYATIQKDIVNDLPYIPIAINATQTFYNTKDYSGWPTEENPYAYPPSWATSAGLILASLKPLD